MTTDYDDNPEFNAELDADGAVQVAGSEFYPSRILFEMEEDTYALALLEWKERRRADLAELLVEIREIRENGRRLDALAVAVEKGTVIPFVGAGLMVACGIPAWTPFLVGAAVHAGLDEGTVQMRLASGEYEEVAADVVSALGSPGFNEYVRGHIAPFERLCGPILDLPGFCSACAITTNFDTGLETVFEKAGRSFDDVLIGGEQIGFAKAIVQRECVLLKLHGHVKRARGRVLTQKEYEAEYGTGAIDFNRDLPKGLRKAYLSGQFLFLGCSLGTDRTLDLFAEVVVAEGADEVPEHFAVLPQPEASELPAREKFLNDRHIFPIWFPDGEYDSIEAITKFLGGSG